MAYEKPKDYIDVAERLMELREKYPTASLQRKGKIEFVEFGGQSWVVYTAACYRTPDDERPGIGTAWEPVPGKTPFTRDSELQNAETAAWGRSIVAVLAADTRRNGIATTNEIEARTGKTVGAPIESKPQVDAPDEFIGRVLAVKSKEELTALWDEATNGGFHVSAKPMFSKVKEQFA